MKVLPETEEHLQTEGIARVIYNIYSYVAKRDSS